MFKKLLAFLAALVCFASLAKAEDVPDSMRFRFIEHQGIQWISAEGTITLATPNDFRMFVAQHHDQLYEGGPLVVLNSPGGNLAAGLTLGMAFRAAHIKTAVGATIGEGDAANQVTGSCYSACAYAFLGGTDRLMLRDSVIGFHQFSHGEPRADDMSRAQSLDGTILLYLKRMGVDPEVLTLATSASPSEINSPDAKERARLHITTRQ